MHRLLSSVRLKLIANSFWELKTPEFAPKCAAGIVEGFRNFGTSNGCWRRERTARTMQEEIVDALRLGERNRASYLLSELVHENHTLRAGDFVYILQYCSRAPDPLFVLETWKLMDEKGIEISCKCYFLTVRALCKGGYLNEALNFVNLLGENSEATPTLPVFNTLLGACVQMHSLNYTNECLNLMEHRMVGRNEITYAELLKVVELWK